MSQSIVCKLVSNDWKLNQKPILAWSTIAVLGVVVGTAIPGLVAMNIGFSIMICAMIAAAFHLMVHTIIYEKIKSTRIFILSLPFTYRQYTLAKIALNFFVFVALWAVLSSLCLWLTFSLGVLPRGSLPMMTLVLMAFLPAYSIVLSVCVVTQSLVLCAVTSFICSTLSAVYLWRIVYLESVGPYVWGSDAVWSASVYSVILAQVLVCVAFPLIAACIEFKKKDFV